jgi:hypothetical protein
MILIILGLVIVLGGVGGVEQSQTDFELLLAALISAFGLMMMASGVTLVKEQ